MQNDKEIQKLCINCKHSKEMEQPSGYLDCKKYQKFVSVFRIADDCKKFKARRVNNAE